MTVLAGLGFTAPWLLLGLAALPLLWLILRAVPRRHDANGLPPWACCWA